VFTSGLNSLERVARRLRHLKRRFTLAGVRVGTASVVFALTVAGAGPVRAHVALLSPASRYGADVLKEGPCGIAGGTRSENVTELKSGAEIEVVWEEYVDHPGHFRIAFDADGDDDFVDPACRANCNTRTPDIETYSNPAVLLDAIADTPDGGTSSARVTLPDIECDRCTLQVIQVMYDKPPYITPGNDIYYQCADLVLRRRTPDPCDGDCDASRTVSVDELVVGIRILLGIDELEMCPGFDANTDGHITVDDVVRAVSSVLHGCP
jgi:hypothetical protein